MSHNRSEIRDGMKIDWNVGIKMEVLYSARMSSVQQKKDSSIRSY